MPGKLPIRAFLDDLADAIANPSPSRPMREAVGVQGRKVCDALSVVPPWARALPGLQRDLLFTTCAPYWDAQAISPPVLTSPFSGGQCPGIQYGVNVFRRPPGPGNVGSSLFARGPITELSATFLGSNTYRLQVTGSNGSFTENLGVLGGEPAPQLTLYRVDGQPDNCGDPPGDLQPGPNPAPSPPTIPIDEQPFNDPESGPLLPIPDLPGLPGLPGIPWRNPFAPGGPLTGIPGDPGDPGDPVDTTGPGDVAEGEAEPGSELVALKLTLLETPQFSQRLQNDVFRSVAFVYMGTVAGLDQDAAGALVRDGQLVYAERSGLTKWRVAANVGFTVRVTPFYQEVN